MFSKACEYGIRASIYIADQSMMDNRVSLKAIADEIDSPEAFTAKILQQLTRHNIIDSHKGPSGGFEIEKEKISHISLSEIVYAIDGDQIYTGCGLGLNECNERHPCPLHHDFKKVRDDLKRMLESTSLKELAEKLEVGDAYLKI
jgi:Rrf2 family protein